MSKYVDIEKLWCDECEFREYCDGASCDVHFMPLEDVEQIIHAHWIIDEYDYYDCSHCGEAYYNGCDSTEEAMHRLVNGDAYKYCPYCGAHMDDEDK